jgi:hypothetical protein
MTATTASGSFETLPTVTTWLAGRARRLAPSLFDTYRPELHYMRGPGPKWRQKHCRQQAPQGAVQLDEFGIPNLWKAGA